MKKFFTLMAVAMLTVMSANAQTAGDLTCSLRAGGALSTVTNNDDAKQRLGWTVGADFDYYLSDKVALCLDISHDYIGAKSKVLDEKMKLEYIGFGPMVKYHLVPWFALQAGPEINFLTKAKLGDESIKSACKKTEFTLPIGVSFEKNFSKGDNSLILDLRYRLGLTGYNESGETSRNSALIFTVGYKFSLLGE